MLRKFIKGANKNLHLLPRTLHTLVKTSPLVDDIPFRYKVSIKFAHYYLKILSVILFIKMERPEYVLGFPA